MILNKRINNVKIYQLIIAIAFLYLLAKIEKPFTIKNNLNIWRNDDFNGVLDTIKIDHKNHGAIVLYFNNRETGILSFYFNDSCLKYLHKNDVIKKVKGETKISIYRKNNLKIFYPHMDDEYFYK